MVIEPGDTRSAFTLIECLAALTVLALIILLWQPMIRLATTRPKDGEIVALLATARHLDDRAVDGLVTTSGDSLVIVSAENKQYLVNHYHASSGDSILRMTTDKGGYMPMLNQVSAFRVRRVAKGTVRYTIRLLSGLTFTGILTSNSPVLPVNQEKSTTELAKNKLNFRGE